MTDSPSTEPVGIRRRSVLLGGAAVALGVGAVAPTAQAAAAFVKGADVTWLPQMKAKGYYWNNRPTAALDGFL